jgi:hypothetical protein
MSAGPLVELIDQVCCCVTKVVESACRLPSTAGSQMMITRAAETHGSAAQNGAASATLMDTAAPHKGLTESLTAAPVEDGAVVDAAGADKATGLGRSASDAAQPSVNGRTKATVVADARAGAPGPVTEDDIQKAAAQGLGHTMLAGNNGEPLAPCLVRVGATRDAILPTISYFKQSRFQGAASQCNQPPPLSGCVLASYPCLQASAEPWTQCAAACSSCACRGLCVDNMSTVACMSAGTADCVTVPVCASLASQRRLAHDACQSVNTLSHAALIFKQVPKGHWHRTWQSSSAWVKDGVRKTVEMCAPLFMAVYLSTCTTS